MHPHHAAANGFALFLFLSVAGLYFLPSIVAAVRKKTNTMLIVVVNLFLGWTFIGWVVALAWAVAKDK
jgi:Superinfection immunity protein